MYWEYIDSYSIKIALPIILISARDHFDQLVAGLSLSFVQLSMS